MTYEEWKKNRLVRDPDFGGKPVVPLGGGLKEEPWCIARSAISYGADVFYRYAGLTVEDIIFSMAFTQENQDLVGDEELKEILAK